jgi:hypothetical protein
MRYGDKIIGLGAVSSKKIDVFSIDKNGNMEYEFSGTKKSANQKLSAYLMSYYTKNFGGSEAIKNLKSFNRNRVYLKKPINSYKLKQKNVIALQINNA